MVEQSAVNRWVTSSNLVSGARYKKPAIPSGRRVFPFNKGGSWLTMADKRYSPGTIDNLNLSMAAGLHPFTKLAALVGFSVLPVFAEFPALLRCPIAKSVLPRLSALLPIQEPFSFIRRQALPAFLQLPSAFRRQLLKPFPGAAQFPAFLRRQFAEAIKSFTDMLALLRRHSFPGLHSLFHVAALVRCEGAPSVGAFFQPRLSVRR